MTHLRTAGALRQATVIAVMALATLAAVGNAHAASDASFDVAFQHFRNASEGESAAAAQAADEFNALLKAEPANPVLMAYAGAATALEAGAAMQPWKKMAYAEDGLALLDKSLAMLTPAHDAPIQRGTPGSLEVRFVAASTFLAVPGFMNRGARGAKLLSDVLASPLFARAPLPFQGTVWMRAAALAAHEQRRDDARRYLNEVVTRGAPQADKARALLAGIPA
ncbi:MAG: hypothetical protein ABJA61_02125 [Caldimonas sp.]